MLAREGFKVVEGKNQGEFPTMISLLSLSKLTGFPVDLIKEELLISDKVTKGNLISMEDFRGAMCNFLNLTMMKEEGEDQGDMLEHDEEQMG